MATFNLTLYPLEQATTLRPTLGTNIDQMDDGALHIRTLNPETYNTIRCVFQPMSASDSANFYAYLVTNRATELDIAHNGEIIRGYIDGNSVTEDIDNGLHFWKFRLKGQLV